MPHHTPLIGTIVAGLVFAFVLGAIAQRLRISPIAGYLLAGVLVGPFTPGVVADAALAAELAEIGVILLMFGVGLHFSLKDLFDVRKIALPGAVAQIAAATVLGAALGLYLDWSLAAGLVFGLALSTASTVVLLRALESRNLVETDRVHRPVSVTRGIADDLEHARVALSPERLGRVVLPAALGDMERISQHAHDIPRKRQQFGFGAANPSGCFQ